MNKTIVENHLIFADLKCELANVISRCLMVLAAFCAALPFRSAPDEAAVADVFGTLSVVVAVIWICLIST